MESTSKDQLLPSCVKDNKEPIMCGHLILYLLLFSSLSFSINRLLSPRGCKRSHVAHRLTRSDLEGQIQRLDNANEITSTEVELILLHTDHVGDSVKSLPQYSEASANMQMKGRESVDSAMQRYQRLVQQMDRSDGRPDISIDVLSDRYFDFIGTCVRTPGQAWMAAVAGLQYVGLLRERFALDDSQRYKTVDTNALAYNAARILLDLDGKKVEDISNSENLISQLKVQNLQLGLLRISARHAVAGENEGKSH